MAAWIKVSNINEIPKMGSRKILIDELEIAILKNSKNEVFALENRCPHKNGALSEGIIHGSNVTCPLHNWVIDLKTGIPKGEDANCVRKYETKIEDNTVYLNI